MEVGNPFKGTRFDDITEEMLIKNDIKTMNLIAEGTQGAKLCIYTNDGAYQVFGGEEIIKKLNSIKNEQ